MKVNFQALGCRLNEAELESWSNDFMQKGHELSLHYDDADVIIFNSCSVTAEADRKSRNLINRIHKRNPTSKLVVTGCYASLQARRVREHLGVDLVIPNEAKDNLVETILDHYQGEDVPTSKARGHYLFDRGRHRAFIKIQDGCRYRCTFCIVTVARGEERSRPLPDIIDEINRHYDQGVLEVVITGVHVGGYGSDTGSNLYRLISEILEKTAIPRIRLASVEPWDLGINFFELFTDDRLMPHIHLPLQSGSDSVLRRMARRCKTSEFADLVEKAKSTIPLINITTDIIAGFPGETEKEWKETLEFVEKMQFGGVHVFSYSIREGTKAALMSEQLSKAAKRIRSQSMHRVSNSLKIKSMQSLLGKQLDILWERCVNPVLSEWVGYTPQYQKIVAKNNWSTHSEISKVVVDGISKDRNHLIGYAP